MASGRLGSGEMTEVTRFAPSPTGRLHLGHAASAWFASDRATAVPGGTFLVRIEDIDTTRCRPEWTDGILEDLAWLGLRWPEPVRRQSEHLGEYAAALGRLRDLEIVYPCFCTRKEIEEEVARAGVAPHGAEARYPGSCRRLTAREREGRLRSGQGASWRLDVEAALRVTGPLTWKDERAGTQDVRWETMGDVVVARKDLGTSYHLAVVVDDALQGVTLVTRGEDLFDSTPIHRLLQALLGLPEPRYHHHPLLRDETGKRFAKRDGSVTLAALRAAGWTPEAVRERTRLESAPTASDHSNGNG